MEWIYNAMKAERLNGNHLAMERHPADIALLPSETWPYYSDDEINAAVSCLRSGKVNQWTGPDVHTFETAYETYLGSGRAIALANGSVALELALLALGIGVGDEVIVTPRSFVASAACVALVGATPIFADVDRESGNITAESIAKAITPRTRAIIPVHLAGWPADMAAIMTVAQDNGLLVIEDCAQAHGARIDGAPVGSFGDSAAFSFCQDKIISTGGEGGLTVFRSEKPFHWARSFKDHGKNFAKVSIPGEPGAFRWLHDSVGTNWRMTCMAAAIGNVQLSKLDAWREARERNARIWAEALSPVKGLRVPWPSERCEGAFYKFYCYVDRTGEDGERLRNDIVRTANEQGLRVFSGSCSEIYREKAFSSLAMPILPTAQELGRTSLMVEVHPTLDEHRVRQRAEHLSQLIAATL